MPRMHIDEVYYKSTIPMLVNFQHGYVNSLNSTCHILENENGHKVIATEADGILYSGKENLENLDKNLLICMNRKTGKVRLVEIGSCTLSAVIPEKTKSTVTEVNDLELSKTFGSKKTRQIQEQRAKLKVNVESMGEQIKLDTTRKNIENVDLSDYQMKNTQELYIPTLNKEAKTPEDVFKLDDLISPELLQKIYDEITDKDLSEELDYLKIHLFPNKELTQLESVLALYSNALLTIYTLTVSEVTKKSFVAVQNSHTLNELILQSFFVNNDKKRSRPPIYKDKALCYGLIAAQMICDFKIDLETMTRILKITVPTLVKKGRTCSMVVITENNNKYLALRPNTAISFSRLANRRKSAKF